MSLDAMRSKHNKRETCKDVMSREERNRKIMADRAYYRRYREEHRASIRLSQRKYGRKERTPERKEAIKQCREGHKAKGEARHLDSRKDRRLEPRRFQQKKVSPALKNRGSMVARARRKER